MKNRYIIESIQSIRKSQNGTNNAKRFLKYAIEQNSELRIDAWATTVRITVRDFDGLTAARKLYRGFLGSWTDKIVDISASGSEPNSYAWISYKSERAGQFEIHFDCTVATIPDELKKPGCGFKDYEYSHTEYVCST